jgi:acyl-CoA hydrolase
MLKETVTTRLVKSQDLNHHGTLFAGRMAEWLVESCFLAASRAFGKPEDLVCLKIHGLTFTRPARSGDAIEIVALPARYGSTSITVGAEVFVNEEKAAAVRGFVTFVTVDAGGKPYAHGLVLGPEYRSAHLALCEEAETLRARG